MKTWNQFQMTALNVMKLHLSHLFDDFSLAHLHSFKCQKLKCYNKIVRTLEISCDWCYPVLSFCVIGVKASVWRYWMYSFMKLSHSKVCHLSSLILSFTWTDVCDMLWVWISWLPAFEAPQSDQIEDLFLTFTPYSKLFSDVSDWCLDRRSPWKVN